jgi:hypothetical protein
MHRSLLWLARLAVATLVLLLVLHLAMPPLDRTIFRLIEQGTQYAHQAEQTRMLGHLLRTALFLWDIAGLIFIKLALLIAAPVLAAWAVKIPHVPVRK